MNYKIFPSLMQSTKYGLQRVSNGCTISFEPDLSKFRQNVAQVINDTEESIWKQELEQAGWVNPEHAQLMQAALESSLGDLSNLYNNHKEYMAPEEIALYEYHKERGLL